ncbi:MAG: hypothetical protein JNL38_00525 [Myxococcales bacterium]|jgi:hypothetical protein|nr:hypothetical protein [Myxococcales bacterium]
MPYRTLPEESEYVAAERSEIAAMMRSARGTRRRAAFGVASLVVAGFASVVTLGVVTRKSAPPSCYRVTIRWENAPHVPPHTFSECR